MVLGVPFTELLWLATAVIVAGVITGLLAGLFGVGGGAVIVPVLYEVFRLLGVPDEVRMQLCIGTSIAIIVPTTLRSYLAHREKGLVIPGIIRIWAAPAVLGVVCGAVIAAFAPSEVFKIAFIIFATFIASKFLLGEDRWNIADDLPNAALMSVYGFGIGLASSLMGIAGGSLATAAGLGVPITIAGAIGYVIAGWPHEALLPPLSLGFVSLIGLVLMAPLSSLTAPYGARLAHRLSRRTLEIAFAIFLLLVSLRFLFSLF